MAGKPSRPRLRELRRVYQLSGEIQELRHDAIAWQQHMVEALCELVGARQGASLQFANFTAAGQVKLLNLVPGGWAVPTAAKHWEKWLKKGHYREDPILDGLTRLNGNVVTQIRRQVVEDDVWHASPLAQTVAVAADIDPHLIGFFRRQPRHEIHGISLYRGRNDPDFNQRERNVVHIFNIELRRMYTEGRLPSSDTPRLSPRELEVLDCLMRGLSEKQVATTLDLSPHTVNDYIKSLYRKFSVSSRSELMALFVRGRGMISLGNDGE